MRDSSFDHEANQSESHVLEFAMTAEPETDLARAAGAAAQGDIVVLVVNGQRFHSEHSASAHRFADELELEFVPLEAMGEQVWEGYDAQAAVQSLDEIGDAWADLDAERFLEYIRERRRTKNRPSVNW